LFKVFILINLPLLSSGRLQTELADNR